MRERLQAVADLLLGVHSWIQERRWLRGGVHHAALVGLAMTALLWPGESGLAGGAGLGFYGAEWLHKDTPDNWTDFAIPAGFVALWGLEGPAVAWLALTLVALLLLLRDLWTDE